MHRHRDPRDGAGIIRYRDIDGAELRPLVDLCLDLDRLRDHWELCGSTANYLALFALQGRGPGPAISASMVLNELVENAVKYSPSSTIWLQVRMWGGTDWLRVQLIHPVTAHQKHQLEQALEAIARHPTEHLIRVHARLDATSGLGLASLVHEHQAEVHAATVPMAPDPSASPDAPELYELTLTVTLPVEPASPAGNI